MKIQFLGGGDEVGNSAMLLEDNRMKILCDYGYNPTKPPKFPNEVKQVDLTLLSHCHIDHSGLIPYLCRKFNSSVIATSLTALISEILFYDSLKVAKAEGFSLPYNAKDVRSARENYVFTDDEDIRNIGNFELHTHSAGHIPGACMYELKAEKTILFTGDLNTINTQLVLGAKPIKCDILIIESTYSGRNHPKREEEEKKFVKRVEEVVNNGGRVIVPAFAVGRTQEVLLTLKETNHEIWVDGLSKKISEVYLQNPNYIRSPKKLRDSLNKINFVYTNFGRKKALKGDVIITTSGMLDGGPVLYYLSKMRDDEKSAIFLTGYQVEKTNGRKLVERGVVDFQGVEERISCKVEFFDFSAHAGHDELVEFIRKCSPQKVILYHGEGDKRKELAKEINCEVILPKNREEIEI